MSDIYTVCIIYNWNIYGDDIKKIINNHLTWDSSKVLSINNEELKETLEKFKISKDFIINNENVGKSGVWKDADQAIKIIRAENKNDVVLIHKGIEDKLYIEFLRFCRDIDVLIQKIVDNEVVYRKRKNIKLLNSLNDVEKEREIRIRNFELKAESMFLSTEFKKKWIKLINNS